MSSSLVLLLVVPCVLGGVVTPAENRESWWSSITECSKVDIVPCLGVKAVALMTRAARSDVLQVADGVSFVGTGDRSGRALSETELQNSLPEEPSLKTSRLVDLFLDAALRFLKTHSLQFKLPENAPENLQRALEEGRGKLKKTMLPILIGVAAKVFAIIPLVLGGLALLATKALLVSKLALVIVAVIGLQKLLGGGGGLGGLGGLGKVTGGSSGWNSGSTGWSSSGGPYYRSFDDKDAQDVAYNAHSPDNVQ